MSRNGMRFEFAMAFEDLVTDQADWSQSTFGSDHERGPLGALRHLQREADEAAAAVGTNDLSEELADCFLLILDAARRAGMTPRKLVEAAGEKMIKNRARKWPTPVTDEPVEHIRD